jgi:hypothetical protein
MVSNMVKQAAFFLGALTLLSCGGEETAEPDYGPSAVCPEPRPGAGTWEYLPPNDFAPVTGYTLSWTGERILLWGGTMFANPEACYEGKGTCGHGGSFDPVTREWEALPTENGPGPRKYAASVWTGNRWIVWGGQIGMGTHGETTVQLPDGAIYDPASRTWEQIAAADLVRDVMSPQLLWTGSKLILWGFRLPGGEPPCEKLGALYDPEEKTWSPMDLEGAPGSCGHPAVWTGTEMIAWGDDYDDHPTGGRYTPETNRWSPMNLKGAPISRWGHDAFWTGKEMIVIAGSHGDHGYVTSGGLYDPSTDTWRIMNPEGRPQATRAAWSGKELYMWGSNRCSTGASYDPETDTWTAMAPTPNNILARAAYIHWAGNALLVWGGWDHITNYQDGAIYYPN